MGGSRWTRTAALLAVVVATLAFTSSPAAAAGGATRGFLFDTIDRTLIAFDPATNTITNRLDFNVFLEYTVRPDGREIYATDNASDSVVVISVATMSVVARIAVRPDPVGIAFTPDSRRAYVSANGSVTAIDTGTRQIIRVITTDQPGKPAASPDGARVYVATDTGTVASRRLTIISTATNTVIRTVPLTMGEGTLRNDLAVSPNGRFVLIENGAVVDTSTDTVVRAIPMGVLPTDFVFADNTSVYLADLCADRSTGALRQISVTTGQTLRTVIAGRWPSNVAVSPDGSRLYVVVDGFRAILELEAPTGRILDTFGAFPAGHGSTYSRLALSGTAPAAPPGERFPAEPRRFNPCAP